MSEGSWLLTAEDIREEIDQAESEINQISVLLQGFDLTRQVLEHRLAEHQIISEYLNKSLNHSEHMINLKEALVKQIAAKLVTDLEKYSFSFFLPDDYEHAVNNQNSHPPGDVILF